MRRVVATLAALGLLAGSCTGSSSETTTSTSSTTTSASASTSSTTQPTTTTTEAGPNPLTNRPIPLELLRLMPLERGRDTLSGFAASEVRSEDNTIAIARLPSGSDEAADIERFGRTSGFRKVLRPARLSADSLLAMDSWVVLFETDDGAAGYLRDFAGDMLKGEDAGHGADLRVVSGDDFVVEEVGETAIGLILQEESVYGQAGFVETLVGFQIGRLLGFVSVLRDQPDDFRIPTLFAAQDLEQRILDVLDGTLRPVVEPPPATLASYAFTYSQTLSESYLRVVYPEPVIEDPGGEPAPGDEGTPPGENQGGDNGGDGGGDGGEGSGDESTTTTSSTTTTTTTLLVPTTDITTIDSRGVVLDPGGVDCILQIGSDFGVERNHVIVTGSKAWRSTLAGGEKIFDEVDPDDETTASDLIYCPGWDPSMAISGVDLVATPGLGQPVEWDDDTTAERFDLGLDALVTLGIAPEGGGGLIVDEFVIYLAGDVPWVVGVDLTFRGTTEQMTAALGPGFRERADIEISLRFRLNQINSPNLTVTEPAPESIGQRLDDVGP